MNNYILSKNLHNASVLTAFQGEKQTRAGGGFVRGEIINAVISDISDGVAKLDVPERRFSFETPSADLTGNVGDAVSFEVVSSGKDKLALKQIKTDDNSAKELIKQAALADLKELMQRGDFIERDINIFDEKALADRRSELAEKERLAVSAIKRKVSETVANANRAALQKLVAAGVSVEKIDLGMLNRLVTEMDKNDTVSTDSPVYDEKLSGADLTEIKRVLIKNDVPPSRRNQNILASVKTALERVKNIDESTAAELVGSETDLTVANIVKFMSVKIPELTRDTHNPVPDAEIEKLFLREGIDKTAENMEIAAMFIKNDVGLSKGNIDRFKFLRGFGTDESEKVLDRAAKSIRRGEAALDVDIYDQEHADTPEQISKESYERIKYEITLITAEHIEVALAANKALTLGNLRIIASGREGFGAVARINKERTSAAFSQLAELSLKLTYEAANRLSAKGINIDTVPLAEAVNEIRRAENEEYGCFLRGFGAEDSDENIGKVAGVMDGVKKLMPLWDSVYADIARRRLEFTVEAVGNTNAARALAAYEPFAAVPGEKYGDSVEKAAQGYAKLLESMSIEATRQNLKAARILSVNSMDVNYDNILEIKAIDSKITDIYNRLHPMIAAGMVKDGLNPAKMNIDDVLDYIEAFREAYGETTGEKMADYVREMDKSGAFSGEERQAVIAIYKMLGIIRKNNSAGLGAAVRANAPVTLGRLMEMSRSLGRNVDITIDDDTRPLMVNDNTILSVLARAAARADNAEYYAGRMVERFIDGANPNALSKGGVTEETGLERALEVLEEYNKTDDTAAKRISEKVLGGADSVLGLQDVPVMVIQALETGGVRTSLSNIRAFERSLKGRAFGESLTNARKNLTTREQEELDDILEDTGFESFIGGTRLGDYINSVYQGIAGLDMEDADSLTHALRLRYASSGPGDFYVPVKFNNKITDINMYLLNTELDDADNATMLILLKTDLGEVRAEVRTEGGTAHVGLFAETSSTADIFAAEIDELRQFIKEAGFTPGDLTFTVLSDSR